MPAVRRKPVLIGFIILLALFAGGLVTLYFLVRHEPEAYLRAAVAPGPQRQKDSKRFEGEVFVLKDRIDHDTEWHAYFTQQEVNSYLAEDFKHSRLDRELPEEISDPRIVFERDKIIIAFRYGSADWNSVVSIEAKVWISPSEPNVVAVEIERLRAGALPLTPKMIQDHLTEIAHSQNIDARWYRNPESGNPVGLLRFQADRRESTFQLQELVLEQGKLYLRGRSHDPLDFRRVAATPGT